MESRVSGEDLGAQLDLHSVGGAKTKSGGDIPERLHIPPNVYFTGTVNIDESTYMFSPKVLDRANVIEFNDVDLNNYEKGFAASDQVILEDPDVRNNLLPAESETPFCSKNDFVKAVTISSDVRAYIEKLHAILHPCNLHFGYRVINEISRFVCYAKAAAHDFNLEEALDIQLLQKILPKFHGTQAKLEEPLRRLLAFCINEKELPDESYLERDAVYDKDTRFPRSARKLVRMIRNLKIQGYTSFIE